MTNTLKTQKDLLWDEIENIETQRNKSINSQLNELFSSISDKFEIQISSDTNIYFRYKTNYWYNFNIYRSYNWQDGTYYNEYINCGSYSDKKDEVLILQMTVGKIAEHFLHKDEVYKRTVSLMDEYVSYEREQLNSLHFQIREIEKQIQDIEREEQNKAFINIFSKGTFKLTKPEYYYYGNGKWDRVKSDEFFWTANESGKTYIIEYIEERRTNPYYDENGNTLEPIFERMKYTIDKRIKKADVESFVRSNMHLAAQ